MKFDQNDRFYFRILRPNENENRLLAKNQNLPSPRGHMEKTESVQEHIRNGSDVNYKSPWISLTAELDVALAFAGCILRVAIVSHAELQKDQAQIVHLDKDYLRSFMTDRDAKLRSRRSDEVLVFKSIRNSGLLDIRLTQAVHPILANGNEGIDFPCLENLPVASKSYGSSNSRFFGVRIENKDWFACLPRPNIDLENDVLFNDELTQLCEHQFAIFSAYRALGGAVPRCALYKCRLSLCPDWRRENEYSAAFILFENLLPCDQVISADKVARELWPIDVLLGNWDPMPGVDNMILGNRSTFFTTECGRKVVRVTVDRALGCTYPEDKSKKKRTVPFEADNVLSLIGFLRAQYRCKRLNLEVDDCQWLQGILSLNLDSVLVREKLFRSLQYSRGLPWMMQLKGQKLAGILNSRILMALHRLPFYEIHPEAACEMPLPRDGHGAIVVNSEMYICAGNSLSGALKDLWKLAWENNELLVCKWIKLRGMPCNYGRYSFSMHSFQNEFILVFGGSSKNEMKCLNDLLVYEIKRDMWHLIETNGTEPSARCRHASHLRYVDEFTSEMIIAGGFGGGKRLDDIWKLTISWKDLNFVAQWEKFNCTLDIPTHRAFLFEHRNKLFLVGGFGRNLRRLSKLDINSKHTAANEPRNLVTYSYLNLPRNEQESFMDSKSLSGFAAVIDEIGERVILLGGGNISKDTSSGPSKNSALGKMAQTKQINSKPRILLLSYSSPDGKDEWMWKSHAMYDALEAKDQLPNLLSWSGVYFDHCVLLFGGRQGDLFSNRLFCVNVRPQFKEDTDTLRETISQVKNEIEPLLQKYQNSKQQEELRQLLSQLMVTV